MIISSPSYIIPGTYAENVIFADKNLSDLSGMELLFFFFDDETEKLFINERKVIEKYKQRFKFTVHLPDDIKPENERILDMTSEFAIGFVVHPPENITDEKISLLKKWISDYGNRFYIENLIGRSAFSLIDRMDDLPGYNPKLCLDTGHLLLNNQNPTEYFNRHFTNISEIHLHGVIDNKDHEPFNGNESWFLEMIPLLKRFNGIINLELFNYEQIKSSLSILKKSGISVK